MKGRVRLSSILTVFFAVAGAWITVEVRYSTNKEKYTEQARSRLLSERQEENSHAIPADLNQIRHPFSFNGIVEERNDYDHDGNHDGWTVLIREGTPYEVYYGIEDTTADGVPDKLSLSTHDFRTMYGLRGISEGSPPNYQSFRISDLRSMEKETHYTYFDLNVDGRLDMYETGPSPEAIFLFVHQSWHRVSTERPGRVVDGFWIEKDGELQKVVFDRESGQWQSAVE